MYTHFRHVIFIFILGCFITSCSVFGGNNPSAASLPTPTSAPTSTFRPTFTPYPTITTAPTDTATPQPTATVTPTPTVTLDLSLAQVKFIGYTWVEHYNIQISFQFPGPVDAAQYTVMLEDETYTCQVLPQYSDRLYCTGRGRKVNELAHVQIFQKGSSTPGYVQDISINFFLK
jgi:hypothetical protein